MVSVAFTGIGYLLYFPFALFALALLLKGSGAFGMALGIAPIVPIILVFARSNILFPAIAVESASITL